MGSAAEPLGAGGRCLPAAPRGRAPSLTDRARARWQARSGKTMATAAAQGAPESSVLRRPRPPTPPANAPQNLRRLNHRCRGPAAASETGPAARDAAPSGGGRGSKEKWVSGRSAPVAGRAGRRGVGSSRRSLGGGGCPTLPPHSPTPVSPLASRDLRRPRARLRRGSAGGSGGGSVGGGDWGSPCRAELRREAVLLWGGDPVRGGRLRLGEGRADRPRPGAGRESRGCGEQRGGLGGALLQLGCCQRLRRQLRWPRSPVWLAASLPGRRSGPEAGPRDPEAAVARAGAALSGVRFSDARLSGLFCGEDSVSLCRLLTVLSWAGKVRTSRTAFELRQLSVPREGGTGPFNGRYCWWGERGSAATPENSSFGGARARV